VFLKNFRKYKQTMCETIGRNVLFGGAFIVEVALIPFHLIENAYYRAEQFVKPKNRW
jgi:hypothetical protein